MSCRVISRGVGTILINCIMSLARDAGARLRAEFVANERNRMMFVSYKFANFREADRHGNVLNDSLSRLHRFDLGQSRAEPPAGPVVWSKDDESVSDEILDGRIEFIQRGAAYTAMKPDESGPFRV